jgi:hypothetical protein
LGVVIGIICLPNKELNDMPQLTKDAQIALDKADLPPSVKYEIALLLRQDPGAPTSSDILRPLSSEDQRELLEAMRHAEARTQRSDLGDLFGMDVYSFSERSFDESVLEEVASMSSDV